MTDVMSEMAVTTPEAGRPVLPKRNGPKTIIPVSWSGRVLRIEYRDAHGHGKETSGTLLDLCPLGPILNLKGARTVLSWDCVYLIELAGD